MISDKYVIFASKAGTLEIFYKENLKNCQKLFIKQNNAAPFIQDNLIWWFTNNGIYHIDLENNMEIKQISIPNTQLTQGRIFVNNNCVWAIDHNNIICYNADKDIVEKFETEGEIKHPLLFSNNILLVSTNDTMYKIIP